MRKRKNVTGIRNQQTGRAGEFFVAAELNRLGANAVPFAGNMQESTSLLIERRR